MGLRVARFPIPTALPSTRAERVNQFLRKLRKGGLTGAGIWIASKFPVMREEPAGLTCLASQNRTSRY
jgi:hypothetical protein